LVYVAAAAHANVVGQQLQRYDFQQRRKQRAAVRHHDHLVGQLRGLVVAFGHHRDDVPFPRLHFLNVGEGLLVSQAASHAQLVARGDDHHGQVLVDQRIGTVLHLTRRVAFRVDVRDFLQLQRALQSDGEVHAPAQEQEIRGAEQFARQFLDARVPGQNCLHLGRDLQQVLHQCAGALRLQRIAQLAEIQPQQEQRR